MHSSLWFASCVAALQRPAGRPVAPPTRLHAVARESQWQWQEDSKWTERENTIRYASEGPADGPPVLFLHGFGSSLETYRDNAPALARAGYRCHRLDLLGLGLSEKAPGPYSIGRWRAQAAAFLEANAGGKPAILVGNSIGSLISLDVAAKRPELVKGLILNNCAGGMNSKFAVTDPAVSAPARAVGAVFFAVLDFLLYIKPLARALFDGVRRNVREANRGGARQAPPLGFPGGLLPFQVVIGGGPANLPPFPGAPGGIAMEDDDFVDVPSPREPPTRRRRTT